MTAPAFTGWIGVGTAISAGVLLEPADPAYARQPVTFEALSGSATTSANINFGTFNAQLAPLGLLALVGLFTAATGGGMVYSAPLASPVQTALATGYAVLPQGATLTDPGGGAPYVLACALQQWAPDPNRLSQLVPNYGSIRPTAPWAVTSALLQPRVPGSTTDDTLDTTLALGPNTLATVVLTSADPSVVVTWCGFQGALVSFRTVGGAPGVTYGYKLVWTTTSGVTGSASLDQFTTTPDGAQPVPEQIATLQLQIQSLSATTALQPSAVGVTLAPLDGSRKVPLANLPTTVIGTAHYISAWNPATNTPALASGVAPVTQTPVGAFFVASCNGTTTLDGVSSWAAGDWVIWSGLVWERLAASTNPAPSLAGRIGAAMIGAGGGLLSAGQLGVGLSLVVDNNNDLTVVPTISGTDVSAATVFPFGGTTPNTLDKLLARVADPLDFGAAGDGVTIDTPAFQKALDYLESIGGGRLHVSPAPSRKYIFNDQAYIPSNVIAVGCGQMGTITAAATWLNPTSSFAWAFFTNKNCGPNGTYIAPVDHDISVRDFAFDYGNLGLVPGTGGGTHAVTFRWASNVSVVGCWFNAGQDSTAMIGCNNHVVERCFSQGTTNAAYDHWGGCTNGRVKNCFATTVSAPQLVNFNSGTLLGGALTANSVGFVLEGCQLICTGGHAAINISPLSANATTSNITITDCQLTNCGIYAAGAVTDVSISTTHFYNQTQWADGSAGPSVFCAQAYGAYPARVRVLGCHFPGAVVASADLGVIHMYADDSHVVGCLITGGGYPTPIVCGPHKVVCDANRCDAGTSGATITGTNWSSFGDQCAVIAPGFSANFPDTSGGASTLGVTIPGNFALKTTDPTGNPIIVFAVPVANANPNLSLHVDLAPIQGVFLRGSVLGGLVAAGTTRNTALQLLNQINVISSAPPGTGVGLPSASELGAVVWVSNDDPVNPLLVYTAASSGTVIGNQANTAGYLVYPQSVVGFFPESAMQYRVCSDTGLLAATAATAAANATAIATIFTAASLASLLSSLPTVLPSTAGVAWLNGGGLALS